MKRSIYILFAVVIFLSLTLSGCIKEITADVEDLSGNPVLNAFIHPDTVITVRLTKSKPVLGNGTPTSYVQITDAQISVLENGISRPLTYNASANRYVSDWVPQAGNTYSIKGQIPGFDKEVTSTTETLPAPLDFATFVVDTSIDGNGDFRMRLNYTIDDAPGEDFYHVILRYRCRAANGMVVRDNEIIIDKDDSPLGNGNNLYANVGFLEPEPYGGFIFSDQGRDGQTISFDFNVPSSVVECDGDHGEIYAEVRRTSRAYYEYVLSIDNNAQNGPFSTPAQIYTNIGNGIGIWAGYGVAKRTIPM